MNNICNFLNGIKDRKVALDLGHTWIFEEATPEYVINYLRQVDVCQINGNVLAELCQKIGVADEEELFTLFSPDLLIITQGDKGAHFLFQDEQGIRQISKRPRYIVGPHETVDTSGAGDAFFSVFLKGYRKYLDQGRQIDEKFVDNTFPIANAFSSQIIRQVGCRGTSRILARILAQQQLENEQKELELY